MRERKRSTSTGGCKMESKTIKLNRLRRVRDMLLNLELKEGDRFDMCVYKSVEDCGTACCAIGWAMVKGVIPNTLTIDSISGRNHRIDRYETIQTLGMTEGDFGNLFIPPNRFRVKIRPKTIANKIDKYLIKRGVKT